MPDKISSTSLRLLAPLLLLTYVCHAMPSFDHGSLSPLGSVLNPRSFPIEIRGVYGGRKKRYIVERDAPACSKECKEKPICIPTLGEIIKDCKCQKCPTGVPTLDGNNCEENCPKGQEKNGKGGCCPIGQVPTAKGDGCEAKQDGNDKKGPCPDGQILDPKHGWDPKPGDAKCQIDDEKGCAKPKISETRPEGMEDDPNFKPLCGEPDKDDSKRPKCDPKSQYVYVSVDTAGKATETCKQTRKYQDRKQGKPTNKDVRAKIKEQFTQRKPEYDARNKEREESLKKLKEIQAKRDQEIKDRDDKIKDANEKKKKRQAECSTPIALLMGLAANAAANSKRDGEHPYDWTTDYFDEEYTTSDDRLKEWPDEVDVDKISADVDEKAFLKQWDDDLEARRRPPRPGCSWNGKRSLDRRCTRRRSLDDWTDDLEPVAFPDEDIDDNDFFSDEDDIGNNFSLDKGNNNNNSSLIERDFETYSTDVIVIEKRNPFVALMSLIAQFASRLAVNFIARPVASIAAHSTRLASLRARPERLFQIATRGQGTKSGFKGMDNAKAAIRKDKRWIKCLREGIP
ncbi:hypothetical protein HBI25_187400 [Parastagonospora nodorum]|nr:hypothetical protein HBI62_144080 [Parastagonospora nodorum]KAH5469720.1 hypothetical protein HBI28_168720 [Parastagonospora nodorum]KAH5550870.1 hypothetical protein HBI25_187400 [Parastagonospora nodorum]KAH5598828.1 hypothetical protein HBI45_158830 [Parastagonospora nodorum]KAH5622024.1 hypothetical protein HBI22_188160 [Parastagonospora nodorum]